jgi:hypothetical protein
MKDRQRPVGLRREHGCRPGSARGTQPVRTMVDLQSRSVDPEYFVAEQRDQRHGEVPVRDSRAEGAGGGLFGVHACPLPVARRFCERVDFAPCVIRCQWEWPRCAPTASLTSPIVAMVFIAGPICDVNSWVSRRRRSPGPRRIRPARSRGRRSRMQRHPQFPFVVSVSVEVGGSDRPRSEGRLRQFGVRWARRRLIVVSASWTKRTRFCGRPLRRSRRWCPQKKAHYSVDTITSEAALGMPIDTE